MVSSEGETFTGAHGVHRNRGTQRSTCNSPVNTLNASSVLATQQLFYLLPTCFFFAVAISLGFLFTNSSAKRYNLVQCLLLKRQRFQATPSDTVAL